MRRKGVKCLLICMLCSMSVFAQTEGYQFSADIVPVNQTGFYNILLMPELKAHLKTDYSDLRLVNNSGKWVPHLVRNFGAEQTVHNAVENLSIVKNERNQNLSELTISAGNRKISNLRFTLRNTSVERVGNLTGSEDTINWFIINDSIQLKPTGSEVSGESELVISFPPNSYKFYKLAVNNKGKAPYAISTVTSEYPIANAFADDSLWQPVSNPPTAFTQKDSGKISYITVVQKAGFHTNRIELNLTGLKYFNRFIELYLPAPGKQSRKFPGRFVTSFSASDNSSLLFEVPLFKDSLFYLLIHNDDNLPLKVSEVKSYSDPQVATVFLEKNNAYRLIMGNAAATPPKYDIQRLNIDSTKNLPLAATGNIRSLNNKDALSEHSWFKSKGLLWAVILVAATFLTFFTYRLIKDLGKTNDSLS